MSKPGGPRRKSEGEINAIRMKEYRNKLRRFGQKSADAHAKKYGLNIPGNKTKNGTNKRAGGLSGGGKIGEGEGKSGGETGGLSDKIGEGKSGGEAGGLSGGLPPIPPSPDKPPTINDLVDNIGRGKSTKR